MSDNLEQLERDWPQGRPKDFSPVGTVKIFLGMAIMSSVLAEIRAVFVITDLRSHHAQGFLWNLRAFSLLFMILSPWLAGFGFYRRMKAAIIETGGSPSHVLYFQFQLVMMLNLINAALAVILGLLSSVSGLVRNLPG